MVKHQINIDVKDIADGAFIEKLQTEFEKAFENIHDPNTEYKPKRVVTASFTFSPDEIREVIDLDVDIKWRLDAIRNIREYFEEKLEEEINDGMIVILA